MTQQCSATDVRDRSARDRCPFGLDADLEIDPLKTDRDRAVEQEAAATSRTPSPRPRLHGDSHAHRDHPQGGIEGTSQRGTQDVAGIPQIVIAADGPVDAELERDRTIAGDDGTVKWIPAAVCSSGVVREPGLLRPLAVAPDAEGPDGS